MVSAFMDKLKFAETALYLDYWGKNSLSSPVEEEKLSMILRSTKQNPSHFPCLPTFN